MNDMTWIVLLLAFSAAVGMATFAVARWRLPRTYTSLTETERAEAAALLRRTARNTRNSAGALAARVSAEHQAEMLFGARAFDVGADLILAANAKAVPTDYVAEHVQTLEKMLAARQTELSALAQADERANGVQRLLDGATAEIDFILKAAEEWSDAVIEQPELQRRIRVFIRRLTARPDGTKVSGALAARSVAHIQAVLAFLRQAEGETDDDWHDALDAVAEALEVGIGHSPTLGTAE